MKKRFISLVIVFLLLNTIVFAQEANVTREEAETAMSSMELVMEELQSDGISTVFIHDAMIEAHTVMEKNTSESYAEVMKMSAKIEERRTQAYALSDLLRALELKIDEYTEIGADTPDGVALYTRANTSFQEERYEETEILIEETDTVLEDARAELTTLNAIQEASRTFLNRYWQTIIGVIVAISSALVLGWKKIEKIKAKRKLELLKIEEGSINKLMKKAQEDRFKNKKLPQTTYKIRMDKYRERLSKVKREIPVYKSILKGKAKKRKK